jgi:dienelactone hydrolase
VAWFEAVRTRPDVDPARIAAIGYCFGGHCVLELARSGADVRAVCSYHGILTTHAPAQPGAVKAHVAAFCGAKDPYAPMADITALRKELEAAGASWQLGVYGDAEHGFTDPDAARLNRPGIAYDAYAYKASWAATLAILEVALS